MTSLRERQTPGLSSSQPPGQACGTIVRTSLLSQSHLHASERIYRAQSCRGSRDESDMDPALKELTVQWQNVPSI